MSDIGWRTGTADINGFRQFWRAWRPQGSTALPVLALHGSLTQSGMWKVLAEAAETIPMLCPDQRGFGLSEDPGEDFMRRVCRRRGGAGAATGARAVCGHGALIRLLDRA